jgi:GNAT superfamily N-acetyltransferase
MTPAALIAAMDATWPSAGQERVGPVLLRGGQGGGQGGGKRVSAASVVADWTPGDLDRAEAAMRARGQAPLFQLLPGQVALDQALATRGYALIDPVLGYAAPAALLAVMLAGPMPPLAAFAHWPPLEIAREIWAEAGIGPARVEVMARAAGAKAVILARLGERPAGVLFVAMAGALAGSPAMVHALEVRPEARRAGVAALLLRAAATWAQAEGAAELSLVVTLANAPARALYARLGMTEVPGYHYREWTR